MILYVCYAKAVCERESIDRIGFFGSEHFRLFVVGGFFVRVFVFDDVFIWNDTLIEFSSKYRIMFYKSSQYEIKSGCN